MKLKINASRSSGIFFLICITAFSNAAQAAIISVQTQFTLSVSSGTDTAGLNGATFLMSTAYDDSIPYINRFSFPVAVSISQSVTISGSSVPINNDTFTIIDGVGFYPKHAGLFSDPGGSNDITLNLASGVGIDFGISQNATPTGALATVGGPLLVSHFDGNVITSFSHVVTDGTAYTFSSASQTASLVPEPSSLMLFGLSVAGFASIRRRGR